jgi:hypothetical protein
VLLLAANRLDLEAEHVGLGYRCRWSVEDGCRNLKQRLGREECRTWTQKPIERTTPALFVALSLLRLLPFRLQAAGEDDWWLRPPWNPRKMRPSVLDVERWLRLRREEMQAGLRRKGKTGPLEPGRRAM